MDLSFYDCKLARDACIIAADHEAKKAAELVGEGRDALLSRARQLRALADRLAQVAP